MRSNQTSHLQYLVENGIVSPIRRKPWGVPPRHPDLEGWACADAAKQARNKRIIEQRLPGRES